MTQLQDGQIFVYCYHPNNRYAFSSTDDIPCTPEEHHMSKYVVNQSRIPDDAADKTYDGTTWAAIPDIVSERGAFQLRQERNRLLAETDWWANSDLTMTAEQTAYRQALRDITDTYTSLDDVVWPTKP